MRSIILACLAMACGGVPAYAGWVPVDCKDRLRDLQELTGDPKIEATWQRNTASVRNSPPGAPLDAGPHPFPKTDAEVIADFKYTYFERLFGGVPLDRLPVRERPFYNALRENRLRIEILKVENWDLSRCGEDLPDPYNNLLRFFDQSGKEIARATQHPTGIMGTYGLLSASTPELPALGQVEGLLRSRFGRLQRPERAQYVNVAGLPFCSARRPCIAFKSSDKIYLLDGGRLLYEIDTKAPRETVLEFRDRMARSGFGPLGLTDEKLHTPMVTLGYEWARARLVGGELP